MFAAVRWVGFLPPMTANDFWPDDVRPIDFRPNDAASNLWVSLTRQRPKMGWEELTHLTSANIHIRTWGEVKMDGHREKTDVGCREY
jgi:hypothetical protein